MSKYWYIVPDVAAGGIFSKPAIQDVMANSIANGVAQANQQEAGNYNNQWATYKSNQDNSPDKILTAPMPGPLNSVVRDADKNPGWLVQDGLSDGPYVPVVTPYVYIPLKYIPSQPLPTQQNEIAAPVTDHYPEGWVVIDPNGTPWFKHWGTSPFLSGRTVFAAGQTPADAQNYLNMYMTLELYNQATGKTTGAL